MVEQYPDTIKIDTPGTDAYQDADGNWIAGTPPISLTEKCRVVPNGSGKKVNDQDGSLIEYSFDIAFPFGSTPIQAGSAVVVTDRSGLEVANGKLLRWHPGQLHNRGWL